MVLCLLCLSQEQIKYRDRSSQLNSYKHLNNAYDITTAKIKFII